MLAIKNCVVGVVKNTKGENSNWRNIFVLLEWYLQEYFYLSVLIRT
jgi:hypothetical protein